MTKLFFSLRHLIAITVVLFSIVRMNSSYAGGCTSPPNPTSASVSAITSTGVTVNGTGGGPSGFYVQVCSNPGGGCQTYAGALPHAFTGLACNTVYYVDVYAYNGAGAGCTSASPITLTFQTTAGACTVPGNDNCTNAQLLTEGAAPVCFTTSNSTIDPASEGTCQSLTSSASCHWESIWYIFQASSSSSTVTLNTSAASTYHTDLVAYGPYSSQAAAAADCSPSGNIVTNGGNCVSNFDDLYDLTFSNAFPTTAGQFYLVQILNEDCNVGTKDLASCIQVDPTPSNNTPTAPLGIDNCGVTYNGTNTHGYAPSNGLPGNENLDNNAGTTCPTCTSGEEVPYVVNNDSWFTFCATSPGTWQIDFGGISNCLNGDGLQMSLFTGTASNLTWVWNASSPSAPGSATQTSPVLSLAAGQCAYLVVDGFAGDQCDYQYTLTNLTGGCNLLPLGSELTEAYITNIDNENQIIWRTASEINTSHFTIEKSTDGIDWEVIGMVSAAGQSENTLTYKFFDDRYVKMKNYYKVSQYDLDGTASWSRTLSIDNSVNKEIVAITNLMGQDVGPDFRGVVIYHYSDGSAVKTFKN